jgi:hypothetical protein
MKPDPHFRGFQAISLGEIPNHERFVALIPNDIRFHLRVLFHDVRGLNVRSEMAHGLAAPDLFGRGISNWVIHSIILIGLLRVQPKS